MASALDIRARSGRRLSPLGRSSARVLLAVILLQAGAVTTPSAQAAALPPGAASAGKVGELVAWGLHDQPYSTVPDALRNTQVVAVAAGQEHNVALTPAGRVVVWGYNPYGQLNVPSALEGTTVTAIAAKEYHSLALTAAGRVVGWGDNDRGESDVPASLGSVSAIAAGGQFSMALTSDGVVHAWGDNRKGQSAVPSTLSGQVVTAIAGGYDHALAITAAGTVVGWGDNSFGESQPPAALAGKVVTAVSAGDKDSLALTSDGTLVAWGYDSDGQTQVPSGSSADTVAISAGYYHSLTLGSGGGVEGWGLRDEQQLFQPPQVLRRHKLAIAAGVVHNVAIVEPQIVFVDDNPPTTAQFDKLCEYQFTADGYPTPTITIDSGSLPPGMWLDPTGLLYGSPRRMGTFTFTVRATNGTEPDALSSEHTLVVGPHAATQLMVNDDQTAAPGQTFGNPLVAHAVNDQGISIPGVAVTFSLLAGTGYPTFSDGSTVVARTTNEGGFASSPTIVAGTILGTFPADVQTTTEIDGSVLRASSQLTVAPQVLADLSVRISGPRQVWTKHRAVVSVQTRNTGPAAATAVKTTLVVPAGWAVIDANGGSQTGQAVTWGAAELAAGQVARYDLTVETGSRRSQVRLVATTGSAVDDPRTRNNRSLLTVGLTRR